MRIQPKTVLVFASPLLLALAAAYAQWGVFGLSAIPPGAQPEGGYSEDHEYFGELANI
ncbi:MAG TPA: hypothetical protein VKY92_08620 [Verrucomicrobiae bacterium]|nr:hypothetical protein [Verrucomicrobiae bacterium]